ncbi:hypothetical protein [Streptomyces sp. NBC_00448]|uniref:hypothetical protein n=1 Tax=Streptomyces sp. NBC_00448 TaxID=2903652 RepID=UPI002E1A2CC2
MAFSADEVRVLRRALAEVLGPHRRAGVPTLVVAPRPAEYVQDYLRLADGLEDVVREAGRMRAFQQAELHRYRLALPGAVSGYLDRLATALASGYLPGPDDLAALRRLRALPSGTPEHHRRTALLRRCETLAENDVRQRLEAHMPAPRRLLTLPLPAAATAAGAADDPKPRPAPTPGAKPKPATPPPAAEPRDPGRRTPTPAEIWPPNRRDRKPDEARSA